MQTIQSRFQRTGVPWKSPGFLNVLAVGLARLNGPPEECWASSGLPVQALALRRIQNEGTPPTLYSDH